MADFSSESIGGGPGASVASIGRRFAAAWVDLVLIPIFLGVIAGLLLLGAPEGIRNVILVLLNIGWMIFRDAVFSPGRRFDWRKIINIIAVVMCFIGFALAMVKLVPALVVVVPITIGAVSIAWLIFDKAGPGADLKLISLTGGKVTVGQAFIRNILLVIPYVLLAGFLIELIYVLTKGPRLADGWAKTRVVEG